MLKLKHNYYLKFKKMSSDMEDWQEENLSHDDTGESGKRVITEEAAGQVVSSVKDTLDGTLFDGK